MIYLKINLNFTVNDIVIRCKKSFSLLLSVIARHF